MTNLFKLFTWFFIWGMMAASEICAGSLDFVLENETYSKNIETKNLDFGETRSLEGHTPTGNVLMPYFHYQINRRSSIDVGAVLNMPFGQDDQIFKAEPIISFKYYLRPTWWYTFGTIDRKHPVLDAFVDDIRAYDDRVEQGFQLQANNNLITQDLWLDWRIDETPNRRENFTAGNYTQLKYKGFMIDGQIIWYHFGGQRNNEGGVANNVSKAIGGGYTYYSHGPSFLDYIGFSGHYLSVKNEPGPVDIMNCLATNPLNNNCGDTEENGILGKVFGSIYDTYFHIMYWDGGSPEFIVPRGDPLYQVENYTEVMIEKSWQLSDSASIRANFKMEFLENDNFYENLVSLEWRFDVPLFRQYFKNLDKEKKAEKTQKRQRKKSYK
ncbi:MAG: hypothetical protein ACQ9MH_00275 [Nitrospinales bacterium]